MQGNHFAREQGRTESHGAGRIGGSDIATGGAEIRTDGPFRQHQGRPRGNLNIENKPSTSPTD
jgi:hypothetical protein